ncbi:MAG: ribonuclease Y [Parcubacteria group bacterium]|nr:ribonuclease Y [Parcubacteria group bacterium]MBI3075203.1 ribonuclease Y [Parcubacteria group bacterium]
MGVKLFILVAGTAGAVGIACGYFLRWLISLGKKGSVELRIKQMELEAEESAKRVINNAEKTAAKIADDVKRMEREKEQTWKRADERFINKEDMLDKRQTALEQEFEGLRKKAEEVRAIKERTLALDGEKRKEIERVAGMSLADAKKELFSVLEREHEEDIAIQMHKLEKFGVERLERRGREILTAAIHRLGNSVAADVLTTAVTIPNDEVKGKIIGKEGRNIRSFERVAGVELIIDDTPGSVIISAFDPVRRQIARVALENLILDGRIQPVKIEDSVVKAKEEIGRIIKEKGEQAAYECGVFNLDPKLVSVLGRLYFRTSYGQNVLQHSIEMAHISGMLASELGANVPIAKAGALLHDIGKAIDHEVEGTHVEIGRRILKKFNVDERIIQAMQSHHEEYPYETLESVIVQVADAISGGRPGARRDSVENYLKRLQELEAIATSFPGVEKVYAIQAGREVRVFVYPDKVSDVDARKIARGIALQIEKDLKYPGEIKVNVIRESRSIEFAR